MQQKPSNDARHNQHNPRYANYRAPLMHKRHPQHSAQPRYTSGAPRTWKRHQQEHWPQRPTERSNRTPHAEGRAGDCPGPRKKAATAGTGHGCRLAVTRRRLKPQPPWARRQRRRPADRRWWARPPCHHRCPALQRLSPLVCEYAPLAGLRLKRRAATRWCSQRLSNELVTIEGTVGEPGLAVIKPLELQLAVEVNGCPSPPPDNKCWRNARHPRPKRHSGAIPAQNCTRSGPTSEVRAGRWRHTLCGLTYHHAKTWTAPPPPLPRDATPPPHGSKGGGNSTYCCSHKGVALAMGVVVPREGEGGLGLFPYKRSPGP